MVVTMSPASFFFYTVLCPIVGRPAPVGVAFLMG
jgi:hypothetical protein